MAADVSPARSHPPLPTRHAPLTSQLSLLSCFIMSLHSGAGPEGGSHTASSTAEVYRSSVLHKGTEQGHSSSASSRLLAMTEKPEWWGYKPNSCRSVTRPIPTTQHHPQSSQQMQGSPYPPSPILQISPEAHLPLTKLLLNGLTLDGHTQLALGTAAAAAAAAAVAAAVSVSATRWR